MSSDIGPFTGVKPHAGEFMNFHCNRCGRSVDSVGVEYVTMTITPLDSIFAKIAPTGEVIVTVACHGEEIVISNQRGVIGEKFTSDSGASTEWRKIK